MTFNFLEKRKKKAAVDQLKIVSKSIDVKLETFSSHLRQIDSEYQTLMVEIREIKEMLRQIK